MEHHNVRCSKVFCKYILEKYQEIVIIALKLVSMVNRNMFRNSILALVDNKNII